MDRKAFRPMKPKIGALEYYKMDELNEVTTTVWLANCYSNLRTRRFMYQLRYNTFVFKVRLFKNSCFFGILHYDGRETVFSIRYGYAVG